MSYGDETADAAVLNVAEIGQMSPSPIRKRRKIRKGTQSCWECRRRKIRCTFATPMAAVCDGCRSRSTTCVGQEYCDQQESSGMVDLQTLGGREMHVDDEMQYAPGSQTAQQSLDCNSPPHKTTYASHHNFDNEASAGHEELIRLLIDARPSKEDMEVILSVSVGTLGLFHGVVCKPYSAVFSGDTASLRCLLQQPPKDSHPAQVARELLLLCSFLQGVPSRFADRFSDLTCDYRILMSRAFNAATRFVTSDEELTASIEGVECVMLESMYLNNAGNLRRAWLANRRAMLIAQMMGLHTDKTTATIVWLRDETRDRIDKDYMWSRIVFTDRYLSLMLGLPQGSAESVFASPNALNSCGPLERMERMESVAGGLIIQRNETEKTDAAVTNQVDTILQEAAALMPPQWWLVVPHLANLQDGDAKAFEESTRIMFQFTHHHLLVQLHLPYVMLSTGVRHDYSKMTAASASRSIIALFIAFRSSSTSTAYCRGVDFIAFIASTVLCLVHIEARRQGSRDGVSGLQSLQHQRLTDRGMLERTLEIMDNMAITSNDVVAQKIAKILEPLLAVEDDSYTGGCYNIQASTEENVQEPQSLGSITEATHALRIHIPYFGTIRIEHHAPDHGPGKHTKLSTRDQSVLVSREHINRVDEGVSSAATQPVGYEISATQSVNHDWQTVPSFVPQPNEARPHQSISQCSPPPAEEALNAHLLVPGLSVGVDDWVLQGVDMALFSTIVQDTVTSN